MKTFSLIILFVLISGCSERVRVYSSKIGADAVDVCEGTSLTSAPYAGGDGTFENPYTICTASQLAAMAAQTSDFESSFKLLTDIDMTGVSFDGIGSSLTPFKGRFHGNSKVISNLTILRMAGDNVGLFNEVQNAHIKDIIFADPSISASASNNVAVVTGKSVNAFIKNITLTNAAVSGAENTGTLAGLASRSTFVKSSISGTVTGQLAVGGAIGSLESSFLLDSQINAAVDTPDPNYGIGGAVGVTDIVAGLQKVSVVGTVTADYSAGGIIGESYADLTLYRSSFNGTINTNSYAGGICGAINRPSTIGSVSSNYTIVGTRYLGGVIGDYYGNSNISDVLASGTITTSGASEGVVGGFFGSLDDWGMVQNSLGVVSISGSPEYAGGFTGRRFSGADPFTVDNVAVASNVTGSSPSDIIGLFTGGGFDQTYLGSSYFWSGGVCNNTGVGNCLVPVQTPISALSDFYDSSQLPFSNWDFTEIWQSNTGAYPSLRQTQLYSPVVSHSCPSALKDLPYLCDLSITDADQYEFHAIDFQDSSTCQWMFSLQNNLVGTPATPGSCQASFQVTDGTYSSTTQSFTIETHDEITITPSYSTDSFSYDVGSGPASVSASVTTVTITNTKSIPLNAFSIAGLTEGSYTRTGGTCGASIPASSSCTVDIDFTPSSIGTHLDRMLINYHDGTAAVTVHYRFTGEGY